MTLRRKTLLLIGGMLLVLLALLYGVTRTIFRRGFDQVQKESMGSFASIEQEDTRKNVARVEDALRARLENLSVKAMDWAQWDDTYRFVQDRNQEYITSNLTSETLPGLKINFILFFGLDGNLVQSVGMDLESATEVGVPPLLLAQGRPGGPMATFRDLKDTRTGILMLPEGPILVASRPIVKSDGSGPPRGTVIFGRYLDEAELADLAKVTHLDIRTQRLDGGAVPEEYARVRPRLEAGEAQVLQVLSADWNAGYCLFRDISGQPALMIRVTVRRDIHRQGLATVEAIRARGETSLLALAISIVGVGLLLGTSILILLERSVLRRLTRLSTAATDIGQRGDFSARVDCPGSDEIASLGQGVNEMLGALAASHEAMEKRNAEMRLILDSVPVGLVSLDESDRVLPEHSLAARSILGKAELDNLTYAELLGLGEGRADEAAKIAQFTGFFRQALLSEKEMAGLNPLPEILYHRDGAPRWLRLRYYLIHRAKGLPNHILALLEDITEEKRLAEQVQRSQRENLQLKVIAENPELFREFLLETRRILEQVTAQCGRIEAGREETLVVHTIFRGVHTIKGIAGSFNLVALVEMASNLEEWLSSARDKPSLEPSDVEHIRQSLGELEQAFGETLAYARKILGDEVDTQTGQILRIGLNDLKRCLDDAERAMVAAALAEDRDPLVREVRRALQPLRWVPAGRGLAKAVRVVPGLAKRLGKEVDFQFDGQDTPMDCEVAQELNTPMVHLLRNAMDHGLETLEERFEAEKPETGRLRLRINREENGLTITLADDGRGMDPEKLKAVALRKGLLKEAEAETLSREECLALILRPGFSTAERITDVSGRGVGMDAVTDSICEKLGGSIQIDSQAGAGTTFALFLPDQRN